uniref:Sulfotransferase n=1 Tax=Ciona savignyi TaxID=51511 RepID=H2ZE83_CIOSA
MKVIVAGFSKTGTKSMVAVCNELGYKTYDFIENFYYLGKDWNRLMSSGGTVEDFKRMYKDVDATVDAPSFHFWEEIHQAFPDAKIILTIRDEDSWYLSLKKQMENLDRNIMLKILFSLTPIGFRMYSFFKNLNRVVYGHNSSRPRMNLSVSNEMLLRQIYKKHNAYVLKAAPKDKLLVYNVKEGWEPICKFLGKPIPNKPFPHKNKSASLYDEMMAENPIAKQGFVQLSYTLLVFAVIAALCFSFYRR